MISNNGHIQAEAGVLSTLEKTEGTMSLTEQSRRRCPWTFSHKAFCKGSSNLILCIGVGLDHDFDPPCLLLPIFSPEVFHPCFSCHPTVMDLGTGFDISSPSISTQGPITTKTCISNTLLVPRSEHTFLPDPTSPPWVDSQTSDSFSSFSDLGAAHHSCFSFIPKSTLPSWRPTNHTVIQSHSWSFKQSCRKTSPFLPALLPNLHNWSSSTQDQDLDCYFTVHWLISIFSSDFFFYLFTFLALCLCPSSAFICQTSSFLQSTA